MTEVILREAILPRMDGIRKNVERLRRLGELGEEEFFQEDSLALAQHYLRLSIEGVFHIGTHILARLPGGRATKYKEIAEKLGELAVVPRDFAEKRLVPMAGMRNLLVHDYADIDFEMLRAVVQEHLGDFEQFLRHVSDLIEDPARLRLAVN